MAAETEIEPKMRAGRMVPTFVLPSTGGGTSGPGAYRSRYNLVLVFIESSPGAETYLSDLAKACVEIQEEQGRVLAVVRVNLSEAREIHARLGLPFPLLADEDGQVTARMLGAAKCGLCVADRFGEAVCLETAGSPQGLPPSSEALHWLIFIQAQCPE